jgi:hypothetical protein
MTDTCVFHDGKCVACGRQNRSGLPDAELVANCLATVCVHLGAATGDVEAIKCDTCNGNVRIKFAVHECAVNGMCLPAYNGSKSKSLGCEQCRKENRGFTTKTTAASPSASPVHSSAST